MQAHDGRAIAKRCYLCKATPSAVGKRGEASHADLGGVRLLDVETEEGDVVGRGKFQADIAVDH